MQTVSAGKCGFEGFFEAVAIFGNQQTGRRVESADIREGPAENLRPAVCPLNAAILDIAAPGNRVAALLCFHQSVSLRPYRSESAAQSVADNVLTFAEHRHQETDSQDPCCVDEMGDSKRPG